ncbi:UDP-N-acetylmuramoyl-L-alanine--D-glutamate ligase [Leptospira levettii]|uniref:UDP-N-acetylmuramoyl-L-alanine--D-glutamate ligase n=1 Tax=Leptospira levettii TaxID=2023178 RepID=UPI00223D9929|nr:UDP-N-acetylmuramoyl-L-alanine--D-glutamate ligase [Leptospira levettii]MCW7508459.1 UDP-N-acetylmuramoyl-L-alanine--D-glutamate ligase [Leptospira levettii]MCW7519549.1 UDP-N-acetylmuramoyl-L-alanine--D-glutamate ligase [Leptospira levettii]
MFSQSMLSPNDLKNLDSYLILGGGSSGDSAALLLNSLGKKVILADRFPEKANPSLYLKVLSDLMPQEILDGIDCIIKSPGILPDHPILEFARGKQIPILSEIALGRIFFNGPVIGITGTDGKSTTTALTYHLLKKKYPNAKMGGNIGVPFTSFCRENPEIVVLELSSYQLDDSPNLQLTASAILNLASDHLERHKTMESYALAKWKIQNLLDKEHQCFVNPNFFNYTPFVIPTHSNLHLVGEKESYFVTQNPNKIHTPNHEYDVSLFPLKGKHNLMNLCFAIALAEVVGLSPDQIQSQLETFDGLPHRFQSIPTQTISQKYQSIRFINDSKSTNLHSMLSGISGFQKGDPIYLILGGIPKVEPIFPLIKRWKELECPLFVFGKAKEVWSEDLNLTGLPVFYFDDLKSLITDIKERIDHQWITNSEFQKEETLTVIFSPAGASFDLYKNFEERGNHFKNLIQDFFGSSLV